MDPPPPQLVGRLAASGLCQPRDLRRCRARVRRLARDLPLFETVWLDALIQERKLTAFQAELLASDNPDQLSIGPFVLVDRLGSDGRFAHFLARRRDVKAPYLLSRTCSDPESPQAAADRLQAFRDRTASISVPGLAQLHGFEQVNGQLWVASPWTPGTSLQQLIVRRGRFPAACVATIGQQLCDAITALMQAGVLHGDIRPRYIKVTPQGAPVLIVPGLRSAFFPEQSIHASVPPDDCDGIAPELIGGGQPASAPSEAYALGCVLWELLAGRPPFPHGDPLAKLGAHQTQRIPDVRDWAPETPAALAELIQRLTSRNPSERPQNFREIASSLQGTRRASRRQLRQFVFGDLAEASISREEGAPSRAKGTALAALVAFVAAVTLLLSQTGVQTELLSIARKPSSVAQPSKSPDRDETLAAPVATSPESGLQPLPQPDVRGIVELHGRGPFAASDLAASGKLVIRGTGNVRPLVLIADEPWRIRADQLILENLEFQFRSTSTAGDEPGTRSLVQIDATQLALRRCRFDSSRPDCSGIAWMVSRKADAASRKLILVDAVFCGCAAAVKANGPPASISFDNVLHCGSAALLEYSTGDRTPQTIAIEVNRTTIRGPSPLLACRTGGTDRLHDMLTLTLVDSVIELDRAALIEFLAAEAPADWQRQVQVVGESTVVPPGAEIAGLRIAADRLQPLSSNEVAIEGLMSGELAFGGAADGTPANSALVRSAGYSRSSRPPGVDVARLPAPWPDAYNSEDVATRVEKLQAISPSP